MFADFIRTYILMDLGDFPKLEMQFPIGLTVTAVAVVLALACFFYTWQRGQTLLLLRKLFRAEAFDEERARTLAELGLGSAHGVRLLLRRAPKSQTLVTRVGERRLSYEEYQALKKQKALPGKAEKFDFSTARFYIAEPERERAAHIYETDTSSFGRAIFCALLILVVALALLFALRPFLAWVAEKQV